MGLTVHYKTGEIAGANRENFMAPDTMTACNWRARLECHFVGRLGEKLRRWLESRVTEDPDLVTCRNCRREISRRRVRDAKSV